MGKASHHVVHNPAGGWDVKKSNAERAAVHCDHKTDAIDAGSVISRNQHTELFIHNQDGKIASRDSHGHDPHPPKG